MVNQNFIKDIKTGMNIVDGDEYKDILEAITDITGFKVPVQSNFNVFT